MALGSWHMGTLKPSLQPAQGFHKALGASEGPKQCRGRGTEVCSQRGAHRSSHTAPCLGALREGAQPCLGKQGQGGEGIIPWPFQHRAGEVPIQRASKASSPLPQRPQGQGSRRVQGRDEAAALGLALGESCSLQHLELLALPPAVASPHSKCPSPPHAAVFHVQ